MSAESRLRRTSVASLVAVSILALATVSSAYGVEGNKPWVEDLFAREAPSASRALAPPRLDASDGIWTALGPPRGRRAASVIYDPLRDRMVLFGGDDDGPTDRNDVWELSFAGSPKWRALEVTGTPPPARRGQSAIYDSARDRMIVFGGFDGAGYGNGLQNDVWALSLSGAPTWSQLAPGGTPPVPRAAHSAIYDPVQDRMVVFGGFDGSADRDDVWTLSLAGPETWTRLNPGGPAPRHAHSTMYDPTRNRMVIFGGVSNGTRLGDAWALDLSFPQWSNLNPTGTPPSHRYAPVAVYDPSDDRMVVFGGYDGAGRADTWSLTFSGTPAWSDLTPSGAPPSGRWLHGAVYDSARDRLVTFGGEDDAFPDYLGDAFALSLSGSPAWSGVGVPPVPSPRAFHSAVYDAAHRRMIVFGGAISIYGAYSNEAWALSLDGEPGWTQIPAGGTPPPPLYGHSAIYDPRRDRMVVFGGSTGGPGFNDVWALWLSGTPSWEHLFPSGTPPAQRHFHSAVYDPIRDRMVVYGGTDGFGRFSDTWELSLGDTPTWTEIPTTGAWATSRHAAIYAFDVMVVYGGDYPDPYGDGLMGLLQFPGPSVWTPIQLPSYVGRVSSSAIYDLTRNRMVVFGGIFQTPNGDVGYRETWTPLSSSEPLLPAGEPPWAFAGHTAIYDPIGDRMVVFGGWDELHQSQETFALSWTQTVSVEPRSGLSLRFDLPWPNPTRTGCTLTFAVPAAGRGTLDIFDVNGRRVRRLASGWLTAGTHTLAWNGCDDAGRALGAGVYFASLDASGLRTVRRIVRLEAGAR